MCQKQEDEDQAAKGNRKLKKQDSVVIPEGELKQVQDKVRFPFVTQF